MRSIYNFLNKSVTFVKDAFTPAVMLIKHHQMQERSLDSSVWVKAHFLAAWINITPPERKACQTWRCEYTYRQQYAKEIATTHSLKYKEIDEYRW